MNNTSSKSKWIVTGIVSILLPVLILAFNFETIIWSVLTGNAPASTFIFMISIPLCILVAVISFYKVMFGKS